MHLEKVADRYRCNRWSRKEEKVRGDGGGGAGGGKGEFFLGFHSQREEQQETTSGRTFIIVSVHNRSVTNMFPVPPDSSIPCEKFTK